jgi:hypothetical protein
MRSYDMSLAMIRIRKVVPNLHPLDPCSAELLEQAIFDSMLPALLPIRINGATPSGRP